MDARKIKLVVVGVVLVGSLGYLVATSFQANMVYSMTVAEYYQRRGEVMDNGLRVEGVLSPGTHEIEQTKEGAYHQFRIHDKEEEDKTLTVAYVGPVPDTMRETGDLMVEGRVGEDGVFQASHITPKCASKYDQTVEDMETASSDGTEPAKKPFGNSPAPE